MIILVDMDDTIENLAEAWIELVNEEYGTCAEPAEQCAWDMALMFPELPKERVYEQILRDELYRRVRPFDGAAHYMKKLIDDGHEVYIVTVNPYQTVRAKMEEILFKYFPFIDWAHVIIASNKQMIRGDVLVDDAPHNLEGGDFEKILFTAAHNRDYDAEANHMTRVNNWEEVYRVIAGKAFRSSHPR